MFFSTLRISKKVAMLIIVTFSHFILIINQNLLMYRLLYRQ